MTWPLAAIIAVGSGGPCHKYNKYGERPIRGAGPVALPATYRVRLSHAPWGRGL